VYRPGVVGWAAIRLRILLRWLVPAGLSRCNARQPGSDEAFTEGEGADVADPKVDPGAFLIAVLTVAVVPLTEDGRWDLMNTVIAVVVGVLVCCYLVPDGRSKRGHWVAFTVVLAVIVAVFSAFIFQQAFWPESAPPDFHDPSAVAAAAARDELEADRASGVALAFGLVVAVSTSMLFRRHRAASKKD
jgi:hypothetical protein